LWSSFRQAAEQVRGSSIVIISATKFWANTGKMSPFRVSSPFRHYPPNRPRLPERSRSRGSPCNSTSALVHGQKLSHGKAILAYKAEGSAMDRRLVLGMSLGMALFLASQCALADPPATKINPESFKLIKKGMTQKQVEEILGGFPRHECNGNIAARCARHYSASNYEETWNSNVCQISIKFDVLEARVLSGCLWSPDEMCASSLSGAGLLIAPPFAPPLDEITQTITWQERLWQTISSWWPW
jgi:hypothetical protein